MRALPTTSDRSDADQAVLFDLLLDAIYPSLNDLHQVRQSRRFWAILLHRYLLKCVAISKVPKVFRDIPTSSPVDAEDADNAVLGPKLGGRLPAPQSRQAVTAPWTQRVALSMTSAPSRFRDRMLLRRLSRTSAMRMTSMLGFFHDVDIIARHVDRPVGWWSAAVTPGPVARERSKREDLHEIVKRVDWPLARMVFEWLPHWYVEEFAGRSEHVTLVAPQRKVIHTAFLSDIQSRFVVARYVAEGAHLHFYQHGCDYGEIEGSAYHHAESLIADRFLTWGWKLRPKDEPFVALRFMRPGIQRWQERPGWLYVNQRSTFPWNIESTLDIQGRFFGALDERLARSCIVRPRDGWPGEVGEHVRQLVAEIDDCAAPFHEVVNGVGLVVFDGFPATSFLECLQAGFPAIAIETEGVPFTAIAKPFYEEFFAIGLLHRTPESAADFVNGLSVATWWKTVRDSECVRDYLRTFCRTDPAVLALASARS